MRVCAGIVLVVAGLAGCRLEPAKVSAAERTAKLEQHLQRIQNDRGRTDEQKVRDAAILRSLAADKRMQSEE